MENNKEYIIISLGGSLIMPDQIDVAYLNKFTEAIKGYVKEGYRFVIITGGGKVARYYQDAVKKIMTPDMRDLDWIGIHITRLNAELLKILFGDSAYYEIIIDPSVIPNTDKRVILGGGWKPGFSTDYCAVMLAESVGAKKIINLSNIDYVYEKYPNKHPDTKPIPEINWHDFRALLPSEWDPGLNAPFDPIAAKKADELKLEVSVMNGQNIENLKNYLDNEKFIGTVIK
jgi:uridylate kinase